MDQPNRISMTPTVARQTQPTEFGNALKDALNKGVQLSGALLQAVPGGGIISTAVSQVTALANQPAARGSSSAGLAATGVTTVGSAGTNVVGGGLSSQVAGSSGTTPDSLNGYVEQMRAESDRAMIMQMKMQNESRDYNTLSNVLKVRHDSAKAAINNIR
jgi:hypothetical protein